MTNTKRNIPVTAVFGTKNREKTDLALTMASENSNSDSNIPILGTVSPQERKRYIRTRIIIACTLITILILVIVLSNLNGSSSDSSSDNTTDWTALILKTTSTEGAMNNSKHMTSIPHILGRHIFHIKLQTLNIQIWSHTNLRLREQHNPRLLFRTTITIHGNHKYLHSIPYCQCFTL